MLPPMALLRRGLGTVALPLGGASEVDVAIMGAGPAGSALAALLSCNPLTRSLRVALLDMCPPAALSSEPPPRPDPHVAALSPGSTELLRLVGAWRALGPAAAPVCDVQVWGCGGLGHVRCTAASAGSAAAACVLETRLLVAALHQQLRAATAGRAAGLQLLLPTMPEGVELPAYSPQAQLEGGPLARLLLEGGRTLQARLVVGADGPFGDLVRRWSQIRALRPRPGSQPEAVELAAAVATASPLQTAFHRFLPTGQLALLPARSGAAVQWTCPPQMASQLAALSPQELARAMNDALTAPPHPPASAPLCSLLGGLLEGSHSSRFVEPPAVMNVVAGPAMRTLSQTHAGKAQSRRYVRPRVALIGSAAHAAPAGLNLGLADAQALAAAISRAVEEGHDIGSAALLEERYGRPRRRANDAALAASESLSRLLQPQAGPLSLLGGLGLNLANSLPAAKQTLLRLAMHGI
ncbi:hypothetical protein ABPG77_002733 [Micractinium sp. CCAP 211/92]